MERDFILYVEVLNSLMFPFFTLDYYNYSHCLSVHLRGMQSLPPRVKAKFEKYWVVNKTKKRFSAIPIDQCNEQENRKVKSSGGAVWS